MNFKLSRLTAEIKYSLVQFTRNRQSIFFTFILPLLFLVLAWFLFGVLAGPGYVDFLLPGIVGIAIMGSAIDLTVGVIAGYRASGALKKIATTPQSSLEWNLSRVISGMVVVILSVVVALLAAWLAFGCVPKVNAVAVLLMISGAVMFMGFGMAIAYIVRDREAANMAAFTVTFPLMLVSGSLFPVGQLPSFLQLVAALSPLTYLNDGLRSAMVTGNMGGAMTDLAIVSILAIMLFSVGTMAIKWRED
jgi:ABC-2 type transport system permease protein